MKSRKGFTLIELMVVIVIVAVLAAVVVPMLLSRIEKAKYSEGKAIASQIATAARAYAAEHADDDPFNDSPDLEDDLGFRSNELDGKYFVQLGSSVADLAVNTDGTLDYTVTVAARGDLDDVVLECDDNESEFTSPEGL